MDIRGILNRFNPWHQRAEKRTSEGLFPGAWAYAGFSSKSKARVNTDTMLSIAAFQRAVDIVSRTLASLPISVYKKQDDVIKEWTNHESYDLLKFGPSPKYNTFTFLESLVRSLMIYRRAFVLPVYQSGILVELMFIPEEEIQVLETYGPAVHQKIVSYRISGDEKLYLADEIIHIRMSSYDGISTKPVAATHRDTLGRAISEIDFGASFYGSGAQLAGTLETDSNLPADIKEQMKVAWRQKYSGSQGIGEVAILDGGLKFKPITATPVDAQYIESRRLTVEDISNITGVPVFLLANNERSTFNNIEHLDRTFVNYTLGPIARLIEAEFNMKLFTRAQRRKAYVQFDIRQLLRGDREGMAKWYTTMFQVGAMSPNDIRRSENLNPYEGGDEYFVQLNMAPADKIEDIHTDPDAGSTDDNTPIPEPRN